MNIPNILKISPILIGGAIAPSILSAQSYTTVAGQVKLSSDSITPVQNAKVVFYKVHGGEGCDTIEVITDSLGMYVVDSVEIKPSSTVDVEENTGKSAIRANGQVYDLTGKKAGFAKALVEEEKTTISWNDNRQTGAYIFKGEDREGNIVTKKFIATPDQLEDIIIAEEKKLETYNETKNELGTKTLIDFQFEITPTDSSYPGFLDKTEIRTLDDNLDTNYVHHYVDPLPQIKDVPVIVRDIYSQLGIDSVLLVARDTGGVTLDSVWTNAMGEALIKDIPVGTAFTVDYGWNTRYINRIAEADSVTGFVFVHTDSIDSQTREKMLPRLYAVVPKMPGDAASPDSVLINADYITEFMNYVNIEAAMGRFNKVWLDPLSSGWVDLLEDFLMEGDSIFKGVHYPHTIYMPNQLVAPSTYDHITGDPADSIGVNMHPGADAINNTYTVTLPDGRQAIVEADMNVQGLKEPFFKMYYGELHGQTTGTLPSGRPSFVVSGYPTPTDRALYLLLLKGDEHFYNTGKNAAPLNNVQD